MDPHDDEGLALSMLLYMAAVLGVLALIVVPVYFANIGSVQKNDGLAAGFGRDTSGAFPLAHLKRADLVDPDFVSKLNAEAEKANASADEPRAARTARQPRDDAGYARPAGPIGGPSSIGFNPVMSR